MGELFDQMAGGWLAGLADVLGLDFVLAGPAAVAPGVLAGLAARLEPRGRGWPERTPAEVVRAACLSRGRAEGAVPRGREDDGAAFAVLVPAAPGLPAVRVALRYRAGRSWPEDDRVEVVSAETPAG